MSISKKTVELRAFEDKKEFNLKCNFAIEGRKLQVQYTLMGNLELLNLPPIKKNPVRRDFIWHHTCFELFIAQKKSPEYWEVNLCPSGDWALYHFDDYRKNSKNELRVDQFGSACALSSEKLVLSFGLDLGFLGIEPESLGISAIIEEKPNKLSYWAYHHCEGKPEFHQRDHWLGV